MVSRGVDRRPIERMSNRNFTIHSYIVSNLTVQLVLKHVSEFIVPKILRCPLLFLIVFEKDEVIILKKIKESL